jgi:hypothetical protein
MSATPAEKTFGGSSRTLILSASTEKRRRPRLRYRILRLCSSCRSRPRTRQRHPSPETLPDQTEGGAFVTGSMSGGRIPPGLWPNRSSLGSLRLRAGATAQRHLSSPPVIYSLSVPFLRSLGRAPNFYSGELACVMRRVRIIDEPDKTYPYVYVSGVPDRIPEAWECFRQRCFHRVVPSFFSSALAATNSAISIHKTVRAIEVGARSSVSLQH